MSDNDLLFEHEVFVRCFWHLELCAVERRLALTLSFLNQLAVYRKQAHVFFAQSLANKFLDSWFSCFRVFDVFFVSLVDELLDLIVNQRTQQLLMSDGCRLVGSIVSFAFILRKCSQILELTWVGELVVLKVLLLRWLELRILLKPPGSGRILKQFAALLKYKTYSKLHVMHIGNTDVSWFSLTASLTNRALMIFSSSFSALLQAMQFMNSFGMILGCNSSSYFSATSETASGYFSAGSFVALALGEDMDELRYVIDLIDASFLCECVSNLASLSFSFFVSGDLLWLSTSMNLRFEA